MNQDKLNEIIESHGRWLRDEEGGIRANLIRANMSDADLRGANLSDTDLSGANLSDADLSDADLSDADLSGANLRGANLRGANLRGADLRGANLIRANLRGANLSDADLSGANLIRANLRGANLRGANLRGANLIRANLRGANLSESTYGIEIACPEEGAFIGYKKASGKIVVLEIPTDAKRSSATTKKCRCDRAKVLRIENIDGSISNVKSVSSDRDPGFVYKIGEMAIVDDFEENRWEECAAGIHFFINKETARQYN